jgi:5-methylcytosine-specific restriction protein A
VGPISAQVNFQANGVIFGGKVTGHSLAKVVRKGLPTYLTSIIDDSSRYLVKGSVGQGNWARCPWISIFDISVTTSAQEGYYPVYLFREDMTGVYLSLNQGVTSIKDRYKADSKDVLKIKATDFRAQIGTLPKGLDETEIDLRPSSASNDAAFYEAGNICARFYDIDRLPSETQLLADLKQALGVYRSLVDNDEREGGEEELPPDKGVEDLTKLRTHKRLERNAKLAKDAKKLHGPTCKACGFNFQRVYGSIGDGFIEAHHLRSLWTMKGKKVELDPKIDFTVLCPNCHRMIHRTDDPGDLATFIEMIRK